MSAWLAIITNILIAATTLIAVYIGSRLSKQREDLKERLAVEQELFGLTEHLFYIMHRIAVAKIWFEFYVWRDLEHQKIVMEIENRLMSDPSNQRNINSLTKANRDMEHNSEQVRFWRLEEHEWQGQYIGISSSFFKLISRIRYAFIGNQEIKKACDDVIALTPMIDYKPEAELQTLQEAAAWRDRNLDAVANDVKNVWIEPLDRLMSDIRAVNRANENVDQQKKDERVTIILFMLVKQIGKSIKKQWNEPWQNGI